MKNLSRLMLVLLLMMVALAPAQKRRRDPLTSAETDQLREVAPEGDKKLHLYVTFAQARLLAIDQLRKDPKFAAGRGPRLHDLLEDFTNIIDELDTNMSEFAARRADIRKPLKEIIQADSDFQLRLRTLKETTSNDPELEKEARNYSFVLTDATEAVDSNLADARDMLEKQEADIKAKKEEQKHKKK